jgi:glycosyltransferase involved in cell wall biosynthesis
MVSLITATYNCDSTIKNCLASIAQQTYRNIEHIVIDGGSTDKTLDILLKYQHQLALVLSEKDRGIYDALNKGIQRASGDIVGILHSDDFFQTRNVIADIVEIFRLNPEIPIVIGSVVYVDCYNTDKVMRLYSSKKFRVWMLRFGFIPAHTATFIRKDAYQKIGLYNTKYVSAGDFEFFVRAFWLHKIPFLAINQVLVRMRIGGLSSSGVRSYWRSSIEILSALQKHKMYSNFLFIFIRLPIKKINQLIFLTCNTRFFNLYK